MFLPTLIKYSFINKQHEKMSPEQIRQMQQKKFVKLVTFVSEHSPYYQKVIKENNISIENCKPEDFPIVTKETVIEYFDQIVTNPRITKEAITTFLSQSTDPSELFLNKYYVITTSGSSGTFGYYVYTPDELARGIVHFARFKKPSLQQKLAYIAATKGHFAGVTMASCARYMPLLYKDIQVFDINMPMPEIIAKLQKFQPTMLGGYAFALRKIAEAQEAGKLSIQPQLIQSGGEPLAINDKEYIEEKLKAPVVNVYAASEFFIMGIGKDAYDGMYLMEDDLIFELHDTYTLVTNLFNYTLPLIRYHMTDRLKKIPDANRILPFTKIANVVGRKELDVFFINDYGEEDFISSHMSARLYVKHVVSFQFHLLSKNSFTFVVCLEKGLEKKTIEVVKNEISQNLRDLLQEKKMTKVTFTIEIVDHLWVDPKTGKFRLIVKKY